MTTQTEAFKRYLDDCDKHAIVPDIAGAFHFAWQESLAQPEQEPVARSDAYYMIDRFLQNNLNSDADYAEYSKALDSIYTTPPQRKPLTGEQRKEIAFRWRDGNGTASEIIDMVEAAHGIKE